MGFLTHQNSPVLWVLPMLASPMGRETEWTGLRGSPDFDGQSGVGAMSIQALVARFWL